MSESRTESSERRSLAATVAGPDRLLGPLVVITAVLLFFGWTLPIMTVDRLIFLSERVSILRACLELWNDGRYFLFFVIAVFSVVFPLIKLAAALILWYGVAAGSAALRRGLVWLEMLGRWSMLDVFAVAFGVAASQISLISEITLHAGLYVFTAAVVLSLACVQRMTVLARRAAGG